MTTRSCQCIRLLIYDFVLYVGSRHISKRPSKLKTPTAPSDLCSTMSPNQTWMHGKVSTGLLSAWATTARTMSKSRLWAQDMGPRLGHPVRHIILEVATGSHVRLTMLICAQRIHIYPLMTLMTDANDLGALEGPAAHQLYAR